MGTRGSAKGPKAQQAQAPACHSCPVVLPLPFQTDAKAPAAGASATAAAAGRSAALWSPGAGGPSPRRRLPLTPYRPTSALKLLPPFTSILLRAGPCSTTEIQ
jgi:hypothetical protein